MSRARLWLALGAAYGFAGVLAGVYGAHVAKAQMAPDLVATYRTANEYHFIHALALVLVGLLAQSRERRALTIAGSAFAAAVPIFCGSLYALALTGEHALGLITPVGGTLLLAGWAALLASALAS